jgi:hypothetical protein
MTSSGARPQTAGPRLGGVRQGSALELARCARHAWLQGKEDAANASFVATGDYCRSETFFDASQRNASQSRFLGHQRAQMQSGRDVTAAVLSKRPASASYKNNQHAMDSAIDASILSSVMLPLSGASSFFSANSHPRVSEGSVVSVSPPVSPSATSPPQPHIDGDAMLPITSADAIRRAELERTARSNILETLTMADSSGPPLKQTIGLSSFAQLLRDHHHQTRALDHSNSIDAAEEDVGATAQQGRLFHQRPSTAQPRAASPPPLNCFRPWSSKPLRPYHDPLALKAARGGVSYHDGSSSGAVHQASSLGHSTDSATRKAAGSTLSRASESKRNDPLSQLLKQQAADVTRRADLHISYQANMDALRLRQENLENVFSRIAAARRL